MTGRYARILYVTLTVLALAGPSEAARRSSLSGNLLIPDQDDIFFFPQLVTKYNRMVTFDWGTSETQGSGGLVFGGESVTFGAFAHRSDFLGAIPSAFFQDGDIDNIGLQGSLPLFGGPSTLNWIDVLAGFQLGDMPMGARLSLGRSNSTDGLSPADEEDATAVNAIIGLTWDRIDSDFSAEISYASARDLDVTETEFSPVGFAFAVRRRAGEMSDDLSLGWLGMFNYASGTVEVDGVEIGDASATNLVLGVGPMYRPAERTTIAMYGTFEYSQLDDNAGALTETVTDLTIPGWNIAGEFELASWCQLRAGLRSRYIFNSVEEGDTTPDPDTSVTAKSNELDFHWTTGVGFTVAGFQIDAALNPEVVTTGTDLLGEGTDGTIFGMVSGTYRF